MRSESGSRWVGYCFGSIAVHHEIPDILDESGEDFNFPAEKALSYFEKKCSG